MCGCIRNYLQVGARESKKKKKRKTRESNSEVLKCWGKQSATPTYDCAKYRNMNTLLVTDLIWKEQQLWGQSCATGLDGILTGNKDRTVFFSVESLWSATKKIYLLLACIFFYFWSSASPNSLLTFWDACPDFLFSINIAMNCSVYFQAHFPQNTTLACHIILPVRAA